ncbi:ribonuclease P protein subunit p30 isoform X2 [Onthophagus taurus]|uniref:ribonuclease P protein subunit p30 isoform X2 n=1 Tax=Onthophagus taurus TaxID=166361 RepID=UPI0039BE933B
MQTAEGYFDYCISEACVIDEDFVVTAKKLEEWGYRTIAINQILHESNQEPRKKKKKGEPRDNLDIVPVPVDVKKFENNTKLKILNRLTISFSNSDIFNKITKSPNYKLYHIIAVIPLTQAALHYTCSSLEADIISIDLENKIPYRLTRGVYFQLVEKNIHFEILYSPTIEDHTSRINMIHISHLYHSLGKSKNIITSSGATKRILLRPPLDVRNLGFIFGLNEEQANNSILCNGRIVYLNSVGRKRGKTFMLVENTAEKTNCEKIKDIEEMEVDGPVLKKHKK